jgi:GTP cyclohydrolase IB
MKDIQNLEDHRRINIRKVGVKDISYPITVLDKHRQHQQTVATVNMYVNLLHRFKGTHMSRFIEILNSFHGAFDLRMFQSILEEMKRRLDAEAAHLEISFPYFLNSGLDQRPMGTEQYHCRLHGSLKDQLDLLLELDVPVLLSPVAPVGDPTQPGVWGTIRALIRMERFLWLEDLIGLIEGTLKRLGHGEVTVERLCRRLSGTLADSPGISWYRVVVENQANGYATFASSEGACST